MGGKEVCGAKGVAFDDIEWFYVVLSGFRWY